jgi:hypothetical protein
MSHRFSFVGEIVSSRYVFSVDSKSNALLEFFACVVLLNTLA